MFLSEIIVPNVSVYSLPHSLTPSLTQQIVVAYLLGSTQFKMNKTNKRVVPPGL